MDLILQRLPAALSGRQIQAQFEMGARAAEEEINP